MSTEFSPPLSWHRWILYLLKHDPERIYSEADRQRWLAEIQEQKSKGKKR